ncbi:fatty acid desaturase family protein [Engelhardtia mirabilis]|uniref:Fatty acid desaturase n=1 Tax=Engelhardtia mirabilis TaxID=2528011 RepID=A0A518BHE3_9BACT|nr:Fatty acid desaturase [Planctomycetes bacterium Pla133]QDV00669.1 Fatty acid desaturase [Planctomycetes bacterium Pla86]
MSAGVRAPAASQPPWLESLGNDLLATSRRQRWRTLSRPIWLVAAYVIAAACGHYWALPLIMVPLFLSVVTAAHDVVHGALGLDRRGTEWALALLGAVLFESGHAYRWTHRRHHLVFPGSDDPEGAPAKGSWLGAILEAPCFLPRLWWWAFHRARGRRAERAWLLAEASWFLVAAVAAVVALGRWPSASAYFAMALVGSWSYPLLTVHLPHRNYGDTPVSQTHTLRGRLVPRLLLELTYHLEHHLYPSVPSHNLPILSERLEPWLREQGVTPRRVP